MIRLALTVLGCALLAACGGGGSASPAQPVTPAQTMPLSSGQTLALRGANGYAIAVPLGAFPSGFPLVSATLGAAPSGPLPAHAKTLVDTAGALFSASPPQVAFYLPLGVPAVSDGSGRAATDATVSLIDVSSSSPVAVDLLSTGQLTVTVTPGVSGILMPIVPGDRYVFAVYR